MTHSTARLIALDWGSSRLRAFLLGAGGVVLAERSSADGASLLSGGAPAFDAALQAVAGDWLALGLPALACGMVGSAHGWREAHYVACPADLGSLHQHLVSVSTAGGATLHIVPGLIDDPAGGTPDVMRGEETQLAGLLALQPALVERACVLMPGTHSKWVHVRQGRIAAFRTRMTGELYALLRQHSVLSRLMPPNLMPPADETLHVAAFEAGVAAARRGLGADLGGQLFAVRTLGLTARCSAVELPDYLSGLLIGHELVAGLQRDLQADLPLDLHLDTEALALVGDPDLCQRYCHAVQLFGIHPAAVHGNTAVAGLWQLARQAGLTSP